MNVQSVQNCYFLSSNMQICDVLVTVVVLAPVVQTMDSAVQRINHYPADKQWIALSGV